MPLTEKEQKVLRKLLCKYDTSGDGRLQFDEFLKFMKAAVALNAEEQDEEGEINAPEDGNVNVQALRFLYDGMDMDGSHSLSVDELWEAFGAFKDDDFKFLTKMIFRGADKDNSRKVNIAEFKDAASVGSKEFSEEDFKAKIKVELGKEYKELTYAQFYKVITGETIDENTDPYDGKLPEAKSKCCLLL